MRFFFTILLLFYACELYAQTDSLQLKSNLQQTKPDTVISNATLRIDSLEQSFTKKSDSLKQSYGRQKEKLNALKFRYLGKIDSLKRMQPNSVPHPGLDSLKKPDINLNRYTKKIDSLNDQVANLERKTTHSLDSLKGHVNKHLDKLKLPKEADAKVSKLTSVMDKVSVPSFDSDITAKFGLDNVNSGLPNIPGTESLQTADPPGINIPQVNTHIPNTGIKAPDLKGNLPSTDINTGKIGEITAKAGNIQQQVNENASLEGAGKTLENKAGEVSGIKELPAQQLPEVLGLPGGVPANGDAAKEQLVLIAQQQAMNHFSGKEAVLMGAMDKMTKYKQKYANVTSVKDLPKKVPNELKGKPFIERIVPALTFQFQNWQDFMLDVNPSLGYRFTPHITAGLGWNQRVAFNIPDRAFDSNAKVFGIRSYGEYNFKKGFGFRLDIECMNTPVNARDITSDAGLARQWIWGALVGIKQKYPIYKKLKGNMQLMYNVFDKDHSSPYTDRLNLRIGVEWEIKRKKEKSEDKGASTKS